MPQPSTWAVFMLIPNARAVWLFLQRYIISCITAGAVKE